MGGIMKCLAHNKALSILLIIFFLPFTLGSDFRTAKDNASESEKSQNISENLSDKSRDPDVVNKGDSKSNFPPNGGVNSEYSMDGDWFGELFGEIPDVNYAILIHIPQSVIRNRNSF
jgi:hypothetical protein